MAPAKIKPGKGWYWLGALLLIGGVVGGLVLAVAGILNLKHTIDDFGRFKVTNGQGSATVSFEKPGTYSIYYESKSKVCTDLSQSGSSCTKETVSGPKTPPARIDVTISKDGKDLDVKSSSKSFDYTLGGHTGKDGFGFALAYDSPMLEDLHIQRTCPWPVNVPGGWWPDVLPKPGE